MLAGHLTLAILTLLLARVSAQTAPSITVTNLVQCGTAQAYLTGGVLPYTVAGKCPTRLSLSPLFQD